MSSDELMDEMKEEDEEDSKQPPSKKPRLITQLPTSEELINLTQTQELFKSNLFRLQISELLSEVIIDYTKLSKIETVIQNLINVLSELDRSQDVKKISFDQI
jgi:U3 small nucleolar RNA-associated protein 22